ncbi:MAG: Uncharacterised protein [Formosa sp. Hel1_33_131]|nr:MAG: Uncharacterised protein [Formosa sp. Hel1_33_131]
MGTEVDVSVGLDFEGFIGFYDGDAKNISQNSLEGVFYKNSIGAGASIGFELSGSIAYVQTAADIYGGTWTFIAAGVHGSVGPQIALTGGVKIGLTTSVGQSNYLGSIPTPFSILSTMKK